MDFAPDGRIFVAQQDGALGVIKNGTLLATPAIDLNVDAAAERGLIGITLHPEFALNKWVYLYYTLPTVPARNRISRFTFNGDVISPSSEVVILDLDPLEISPIHNGGCMKFGQDGKLYVTIGDNNQSDLAQNLDTYWGKMIRINPDGSVPSDNPFVSAASPQKKRIWAMGMRNPFTFDIQPGTGRIFINEVGHALYEEIQDASNPGLNFGWPLEQGSNASNQFTNPFYAYGHGDGTQVGCAISGGCFFNPASTNYPSQYIGKYFFLDYCEGWIGFINPQSSNTAHTVFASRIPSTALTIKVGSDGNLYYLGRDKGSVYKIIYSLNTAPSITDQPDNLFVARTQSASFSVSVSGVPPYTYVWKKNGIAIANSNSSVFTINSAQPADSGKYSVTITNSSGTISSSVATLSVSTSYPPQATILTPLQGSTYEAGDTLLFSGSGSDPEDGALPASAFTWKIEFHHGSGSNSHVHDGPPIATGTKTGSYIIPKNNETSDDVFYRLILSVKDKNGFTGASHVNLLPEKSTITLTTDPPNLRVYLDGTPRNTPFSEVSVEGIERSLGVISPQTLNGVPYVFDKWNHGGAATNVIRTPENDFTYTAVFKKEVSLRTPENPSNASAGLSYQYFQGRFYVVPDFSTLTPVSSGIVPTFSLSPRKQEDNFSFKFSDYVEVPTDGEYTFYCQSNDGSKLYIGDRLVINNDGEHNTKELSGVIGLKAGKHTITVGYIETAGANVLLVSFAGPGIPKQEIPATRLFHTTGTVNSNPVVSISSPTNNQNFSPAPASILIKANASDANGSIGKVEFYNGSFKLGEDLISPYEFQWASVASGTYSLSAKAYDNQNASAVSSAVSISVGSSPPPTCAASGSISREFWSNVTGSSVSSIPLTTSPTGTGTLSIFEGPVNFGDNYGTRIRGYICAPQTGDYYFWIASNDQGELWLSKDENPANKVKIAYVGSYTASREWTKLTTQKSAAIRLEGGNKYI